MILRHKTIADRGFSQEMARSCRIAFQLLAQVPHINTQIVAVLDGVRPPDLRQSGEKRVLKKGNEVIQSKTIN
ncbi:hypothetical protein KP17_06135 [Pectobacterium parvum]|nr:hypothetical protein KP17_06135 [Pectobacterium parvum]KHS99764.1 hypothetical protein RC88_00385 [Pectobacterium parvum]